MTSNTKNKILSSTSEELFLRSKKFIPGGVNSPVRSFSGVGGSSPLFIKKARGAEIWDVEGRSYIDFVGSWGPMVLGHANPEVLAAINEAATHSTSFGAPSERELELAELVTSITSTEQVRMLSSGTEATMTAVRLARGVTGKDTIIKCDGCYHGHSDSLLVSAGSGYLTCGIKGSPGVPEELSKLTLSIPFNDISAIEKAISQAGENSVAALIIEPVPGNMGLVLPKENYLLKVRELCTKHNIVLIFDEVMSGFRVSLGGASEIYGVKPDLVTFGKVIGGGLPVGALAGDRKLMEQLAPLGPVYQAGTLSGNPLAMAAGITTLNILKKNPPYEHLQNLSSTMLQGIKDEALSQGIPFEFNVLGSMFGFFFSEKEVLDYTDSVNSNKENFKKFFWGMLNKGIYLAPSPFEAGFISSAHNAEFTERTVQAAKEVFSEF